MTCLPIFLLSEPSLTWLTCKDISASKVFVAIYKLDKSFSLPLNCKRYTETMASLDDSSCLLLHLLLQLVLLLVFESLLSLDDPLQLLVIVVVVRDRCHQNFSTRLVQTLLHHLDQIPFVNRFEFLFNTIKNHPLKHFNLLLLNVFLIEMKDWQVPKRVHLTLVNREIDDLVIIHQRKFKI